MVVAKALSVTLALASTVVVPSVSAKDTNWPLSMLVVVPTMATALASAALTMLSPATLVMATAGAAVSLTMVSTVVLAGLPARSVVAALRLMVALSARALRVYG